MEIQRSKVTLSGLSNRLRREGGNAKYINLNMSMKLLNFWRLRRECKIYKFEHVNGTSKFLQSFLI